MIASFIFDLSFKRYIKPSPALTQRPDNIPPKGISPFINKLVNKTLETQLGISPITTDTKGDKYLFELKKALKFSSFITFS